MDESQLLQKLNQWRPASWEDDISARSLDQNDFHNEAPPGKLDQDKLRIKLREQIPAWLAGDRDLESMILNDRNPIPAGDDREGYMPEQHESFWVSGLNDYLRIGYALARHQILPRNVFEFGCASGRVTRHLDAQGRFHNSEPFEQIWCSDINYRHIRWVLSYLSPSIRAFHNPTLPHLPIESNSLDLVCAFSVFTHIDTFETQWLAEIRRVLRPGGIAYLTVHTEHTWQELALKPKSRLIQAMEMSGKFSRDQLNKPMPGERLVYRFTESGPYRANVFHSENYLRTHWSRYFDLLDFLPIFHGQFQTVIVLQKPSQ